MTYFLLKMKDGGYSIAIFSLPEGRMFLGGCTFASRHPLKKVSDVASSNVL